MPRSVYSAVCATCLIDKIWNNTPQGGGYIIDISSTLFLFRIKCVFHGESTVIVVGAGHAGCEASVAAAKMGHKVLLITMDMNKIAQMSCNPAMGGIAKGQIIKEIDALGGLSGIVTLHDLMEALVGDLYEIEEPTMPEEIEKLGENHWCIYGSAELDEVAEALGVELPVDEYDTYSGFICGEIGRVPKDGESFEVESHGLKIYVHSVESHVIGRTTVEVLPAGKEEEEQERA